MQQTLLIDLFRVLLFPKDLTYFGDLEPLYISKRNLPNYSFDDYFQINTEFVDFLKGISSDIDRYLFTAAHEFLQSLEAKQYLTPLFKSIFTTHDLGMRKSDIEIYQMISSQLRVQPQQIIYVGDNSINVEAAAKSGIQAIQFTTTSQVIPVISQKLSVHE
jgi:FMN phosphatase YigB (HAD superfamily)